MALPPFMQTGEKEKEKNKRKEREECATWHDAICGALRQTGLPFSQAPGARVDDGAVRPRLGARAMCHASCHPPQAHHYHYHHRPPPNPNPNFDGLEGFGKLPFF